MATTIIKRGGMGGDATVDGGNIALADDARNRIKGDKTLDEARTPIAAKRTVKTNADAANISAA